MHTSIIPLGMLEKRSSKLMSLKPLPVVGLLGIFSLGDGVWRGRDMEAGRWETISEVSLVREGSLGRFGKYFGIVTTLFGTVELSLTTCETCNQYSDHIGQNQQDAYTCTLTTHSLHTQEEVQVIVVQEISSDICGSTIQHRCACTHKHRMTLYRFVNDYSVVLNHMTNLSRNCT